MQDGTKSYNFMLRTLKQQEPCLMVCTIKKIRSIFSHLLTEQASGTVGKIITILYESEGILLFTFSAHLLSLRKVWRWLRIRNLIYLFLKSWGNEWFQKGDQFSHKDQFCIMMLPLWNVETLCLPPNHFFKLSISPLSCDPSPPQAIKYTYI